jgi:prephenate dehydratase
MKIAVLGPVGTYSYLAGKEYEKKVDESSHFIYVKHMKEMMDVKDQVDLMICPVENTLDGYIGVHMDLIIKHQFNILSEIHMPISFCFVSHVNKEDIKKIYVQYAAKNQCLDFLDGFKDKEIIVMDSNVYAYQAYLDDPYSSAIIPRHLAHENEVIYEQIQDEKDNYTRFLVMSEKRFNQSKNINETFKVSLVISPKIDRPGLLFDIIKVFKENQINMTSIISRPTKKKLGTYHFYLELEGKGQDIKMIDQVIDELQHEFPVISLGVYSVLEK